MFEKFVLLILLFITSFYSNDSATTPTNVPIFPTTSVATNSGEIATLISVIDGDTIKVNLNNEIKNVRLIGINAPETNTKPPECYAQESKQYLQTLLKVGDSITLTKDRSNTDRYNRLLRYVYSGNKFINTQMVSQGLAYAKAYPPDTKYSGELKSLEIKAQELQLGLHSPQACPKQ